MASERLLLTHLPVELIGHIFSFLPLSDRKSASLVCQLWSNLAFNVKFLRKITLSLSLEHNSPVMQYLRKSSRSYRNVEIMSHFIHNYEKINDILDVLGANLESFCCFNDLSEEELCNVLVRSPNLEQLIVRVHASDLNRYHLCYPEMNKMRALHSMINVLQIRNLCAANLSHLSIKFYDAMDANRSIPVIRRLAPQLKSLEWVSANYFVPLDDLQFPNVEILKLGVQVCRTGDSTLETFFAGFKYLKKVELTFNISEIVLDVLTKACPDIQELKVNYNSLNSNSFSLLKLLKSLKTLSLSGRNDFPIINDGHPLVNVKQLSLSLLSRNSDSSVIEGFRQLLPNVIDMRAELFANS
ncbi:uncharacterized protein LOC134210374 [Armigeres subalbatus]|uniref:uncharacterized protein LOC134210374 n=1 Tax=Armigeres subalbatus TaxID=124917 RepID=UPI002ED29E7A